MPRQHLIRAFRNFKPAVNSNSFRSMRMFFCSLACCLYLLCAGCLHASQIVFSEPLSPRIANYRISVFLDAERKVITGKETLRWKNTSKDKISELQFHLYLNAFKNSESTFMKESRRAHRRREMGKDGWGWIDIITMSVRDGDELKSKIEFIHPDDDNDKDQTVFRVPLSRPLLPNQTIVVDIAFAAKLPAVFSRTGFHQNFFMVAQWFPKIGVYEASGTRYATEGQWNCHQFHSTTEFYADYGVYDVDLTVPKAFVVGATGILQSEKDNIDGTKTLIYRAEDVHDFAWTASPLYKVIEDQWRHVKIRLLMQPQRLKGQAQRYLHSVKAALQYFNDWIGKYPYPNLTIVDPQYGALGAGGMEYPTLITGISFWGLPEGLKIPEAVTVHEFGHQYWYGLVGNNEFEEAWLDEGINQYSESRIMDATYGKKTSFFDLIGIKAGDFEFARTGYTSMSNPKIAPTYAKAWEYKAGGYGNMTYNKTATFMTTLERMIGRSVLDEIMRTYFERWKFRHPCTRDFVAVVNEVASRHHGNKFGENMNWFFDQVLYGTSICDYELTSIENKQAEGTLGVVEKDGDKVVLSEKTSATANGLYESRVLVSRLGEVKMPVDVLIHFEGGKEVREHWDGQGRWTEFKYMSFDKVVWAKVDPAEVLSIDINLNNNSRTIQPTTSPIWKYTVKFLFWIQNILQSAALF